MHLTDNEDHANSSSQDLRASLSEIAQLSINIIQLITYN